LEAASLARGKPFRFFDPGDEAIADGPQRELGIDVEAPGNVDCREEDIADLACNRGVGLGLSWPLAGALERFLELDELFVQILESRGRVGVLEPRGGRTALDLPGVDQGGQVARNIMENSLPALLFPLETFPILAHATGRPGLDLAED